MHSLTLLPLLLLAVTTAQAFEGDKDIVETNDKIGRPLGPEDFANADDDPSLFIEGEYKDDWHFENDMLFGNGTEEDRTGFYEGGRRLQYWTNGLVPYAIADDYTTRERAMVAKAIKTLEKHTCVRFQPRNNERQYLFFMGRSGTGCYCYIGMQNGPTRLGLAAGGCFHLRCIVHEIIHGLGFMHTHQRPDRDNYVEIHLENLRSDYKDMGHNFDKCTGCVTKGLPYDCNSIMHYPNDAFAASGKKTIVSRNPYKCKTFTNSQYYSIRHEDQVMTSNDIATIRNAYCEKPATTRKPVVTRDCPYYDKESSCKYWESQGYCLESSKYSPYVMDNCPASCRCGKCPHKDKRTDCSRFKNPHCTRGRWVPWMMRNCSATCKCDNSQ